VRRLIQYLFKAASIARLRDASNVVEGRSKTFRRFTGRWIANHHPDIPFERFAHDAVCHCSSERQAQRLQADLEQRFAECKLTLHPDKTQIVYCKDNVRRRQYQNQKFDFLGYTFRPRLAMNRWGKTFVNFNPGMSNRAAKAIRQTMRDRQLDFRIDKRIDDLAKIFNPIIRGWIMYYGRYHKSALSRALMHLDLRLACWAMSKYRRLRGHRRRARYWIQDIKLFKKYGFVPEKLITDDLRSYAAAASFPTLRMNRALIAVPVRHAATLAKILGGDNCHIDQE
jgi:hypothetical protein